MRKALIKKTSIEKYFNADFSSISGDLTEISGNIDDCEITKEERKKGIDINALIK
jgi:hypothetical protein